MSEVWKMEEPVTSILQGPIFKVLERHRCEITFSLESRSKWEEQWKRLVFDGVQAFKTTYLYSLGSIEEDLRMRAYGCLVSLEGSNWLKEVRESYIEYCRTAHSSPSDLRHFMICFDDGPCFELICESVSLPDETD